MATAFSVKMTSVEALSKKLQGLKYDVQKKGGRFALRKAAQVVRDQARSNAQRVDDPGTPASIPTNIVERWSNTYNKRTGNLMFRVGVLGGSQSVKTTLTKSGKEKTTGSDVFYWRFLEFGTEKMAARPFMAPALPQSAQAATDRFISEYSKAIDRALKKAG